MLETRLLDRLLRPAQRHPIRIRLFRQVEHNTPPIVAQHMDDHLCRGKKKGQSVCGSLRYRI